jgi:hypothetical protein
VSSRSRVSTPVVLAGLAGLLTLTACAAGRPGGAVSPDGIPYWPYQGYARHDGHALSAFRERFFSGYGLVVDPSGRRLYAESAIDGGLTIVRLPAGDVEAVLEFGEGSRHEQKVFAPDGSALFLLSSTVRGDNVGHVPLARALLELDLGLSISQAPLALRPGGWSRGLVVRPDRGWIYSLDTAGPDLAGGATIARIDLYDRELDLRRPIGGVPTHLLRNGLAWDDRRGELYTLLAAGEPRSDFDPPPAAEIAPGEFLAVIDADSLVVTGRVPLREGLDFTGLARTPRGVVVVGVDRRHGFGTALVEIDTAFRTEVAWLELPERAVALAAGGERLVVAVRHGLYVVALDLLRIEGFVPVPLERVGELAVTPDCRIACVTVDDPEWPGRPALAVVDLVERRLLRVTR